jgi:hypothetical protein
METEKPVVSFWFRLLVAASTIVGVTLVLLVSQTAGGLMTTVLPAAVTKINLSLRDIAALLYTRHFDFIAGAILAGFFGSRPGWRKTGLAGLAILYFFASRELLAPKTTVFFETAAAEGATLSPANLEADAWYYSSAIRPSVMADRGRPLRQPATAGSRLEFLPKLILKPFKV